MGLKRVNSIFLLEAIFLIKAALLFKQNPEERKAFG
jgi:hypothetical protein